MLIRVLKKGEVHDLHPLLLGYLKETSDLGGDMAFTNRNVEVLTGIARLDRSLTTVACNGGLRGFCLTTPTTFDHSGGEASMGLGTYVLPDFRGHGYGKALRSMAYRLLKKSGVSILIGSVSDRNQGAMVSSRKSGAVVYGRQVAFDLKGF